MTSLRLLVPAFQMGPPAAHILAIPLVVSTKLASERWFFVEDYEQVYAQSNCRYRSNCRHIGVPEYNPQANPTHCEAKVHRVANVTVEADNHQVLRRRDRSGSPVSRPAEIPNAAQSNGKSQNRGQRGQPSPSGRVRYLDTEPELLG